MVWEQRSVRTRSAPRRQAGRAPGQPGKWDESSKHLPFAVADAPGTRRGGVLLAAGKVTGGRRGRGRRNIPKLPERSWTVLHDFQQEIRGGRRARLDGGVRIGRPGEVRGAVPSSRRNGRGGSRVARGLAGSPLARAAEKLFRAAAL